MPYLLDTQIAHPHPHPALMQSAQPVEELELNTFDEAFRFRQADNPQSLSHGSQEFPEAIIELTEAGLQMSHHLIAAVYHVAAAWATPTRIAVKLTIRTLRSIRLLASNASRKLIDRADGMNLHERLLGERALVLLAGAKGSIQPRITAVREAYSRMSQLAKKKFLLKVEQQLEQAAASTNNPTVKQLLSSLVFVPDEAYPSQNHHARVLPAATRSDLPIPSERQLSVPQEVLVRFPSQETVVRIQSQRPHGQEHSPNLGFRTQPEAQWNNQTSQQPIPYPSPYTVESPTPRSPALEYPNTTSRIPIATSRLSSSSSSVRSRGSTLSTLSTDSSNLAMSLSPQAMSKPLFYPYTPEPQKIAASERHEKHSRCRPMNKPRLTTDDNIETLGAEPVAAVSVSSTPPGKPSTVGRKLSKKAKEGRN